MGGVGGGGSHHNSGPRTSPPHSAGAAARQAMMEASSSPSPEGHTEAAGMGSGLDFFGGMTVAATEEAAPAGEDLFG